MRRSLTILALAVVPAAALADALDGTRFDGVTKLDQVAAKKATLAEGARGAGVKAVQAALVDMGFATAGAADGIYGPMTRRFVTNFQRHASLHYKVAVTGQVDAGTLAALADLAPAPGKKGQRKHVPRPYWQGQRLRAVVVKSEHRTFLYDAKGRLLDVFVNAHGAPSSPTRSGLRTVDGVLSPKATREAAVRLWGDATVFGTQLVSLDGAQELHGTNAPWLLGTDVSKGCVRHQNPDSVKLAAALRPGDRVAVVERANDPKLRK